MFLAQNQRGQECHNASNGEIWQAKLGTNTAQDIRTESGYCRVRVAHRNCLGMPDAQGRQPVGRTVRALVEECHESGNPDVIVYLEFDEARRNGQKGERLRVRA